MMKYINYVYKNCAKIDIYEKDIIDISWIFCIVY